VNASSTGAGVSGNNTAASGPAIGVNGYNVSPGGRAISGYNAAFTGTGSGVYGTTSSASGYGVYGDNTVGAGVGVYGNGAIGVLGNTTTNFQPGVFGVSNNYTGYGVYGNNSAGSGNAIAVYGVTWSGGYGFYTGQNAYIGGSEYIGDKLGVGIAPTTALQVKGTAAIGQNTNGTAVIDAYSGYAFFGVNNTTTTRIAIDAWGTASAPAFTPTSDMRLKKNITPLDENYGLNIISQLNPVSFNWKDKVLDPRMQLGFVAQDVQKLLPTLVNTGPEGMLTLNYNGLIAPMVKSIQEQQKEIDNLKQQIAELKAK
jgi:hypothetical protein